MCIPLEQREAGHGDPRGSYKEGGDVSSLFPQDLPINGLCSHELFVLARAVSATPPSIAIEALVLGGPEVIRVVLSSSSKYGG